MSGSGGRRSGHSLGTGTAAPPAVSYAAKSTEDTRGSIPTQLAECRAAAEAEDRMIVAEYSDEAASAFTGDRGPDLRAALDHAEQLAAEHGRAELWVQHPDRLARGDGVQATHLIEYVIRMRKARVQLRAVQHDDTFRDLIHAVLTGERNHEDSARKAEATAAGLRRTAERGEWAGGILADGYVVHREVDVHGGVTRRVEFDPERKAIYRLTFDLALKGYSDRAIVLELDRHGYVTAPRKRDHKPRPFDANAVRQRLANPFYAGLCVYRQGKPDEETFPGSWPGYITPEQFERLREQRRARAETGADPKPGRPPEGYVLSRLAVCGTCGSPMDVVTVRYVRKDGTRKRTYVCRAHRERPQDCSAKPIDAALVDRAVVANLDGFLGDVDDWRSRLTDSRRIECERMEREAQGARKDMAECERVAGRMNDHYARCIAEDDMAKADAVLAAIAKQHEERARAEMRLSAALDALESVVAEMPTDPMLDFYNALSEELSGRIVDARGDVKRLNAALLDFFGRVVLTHEGPKGVRITPYLSDATSLRIMANVEAWPYAVSASVGEYEAEVTGEVDGQPLLVVRVPSEHADAAMEAIGKAEVTVAVQGPPSIIAAGGEMVPPLRGFATSANAPSAW